MTDEQAVRVVEKIIRENKHNGEPEGILNRYRVAALNHLLGVNKSTLADETL